MIKNQMKKLTTVSTLLVVFLSFLILNTTNKENSNLISPILGQEKTLGVNQWLPQTVLGAQTNTLEISAKGAIFIESKSGTILYSKNMHEKLPVASLVKVMTALVALEHKGMEDQYLVSEYAANMEPDKMLLIAGERLTLKELLYGVFLISANDAAEVLAEGTTGSREEFLKLMNQKAKQLGMQNTFFANPTGLDEDENNSYVPPSAEGKVLRAQDTTPNYARAGSYSSAYDLAILTRYLIRNYPQVLDISKTEHIVLPVTDTHQDYDMYSGINLLTTYPGVIGLKTGYTPQAGYTLITLAGKDNHEVIGVLLGSGSRRDEARELLDYSFSKLK